MNKNRRFSAAFTLVEMLVSISIFTIITSLVLTNYPKFSEHFALERTAQEVAQSFREAKTLALAVTESTSGTKVFPGYGVHLIKKDARDSHDDYLIFSDIYSVATQKIYDASDKLTDRDRIDSSYMIQADAWITGFCAGTPCDNPNPDFQVMDVVFTRPEPIITFWYKDAFGYHESLNQNVSIFVVNAKGESKKVVVWNTGQISVK